MLYIRCLILLNLIIFVFTASLYSSKVMFTIKVIYILFRTFQKEYSRLNYCWYGIEHLEYSRKYL